MSEKYKPRTGDRVRVVLEGEVGLLSPRRRGFDIGGSGGNHIYPDAGHVISIEKLEPPVTVFKPGDRLRRKDGWDYEVTIADDGYLQHFEGGSVRYYPGYSHDEFTSERYDKLEFIEPPF